ETPLRITMISSNQIRLVNTGSQVLEHLFVLDLKDRAGTFLQVDKLTPGAEHSLRIHVGSGALDFDALSQSLASGMTEALMKEGLYPREASAMVHTWKNSWFEEDGLRVLYILPRAWTDEIIPLKLEPAPQELVRVMVGRAEIISRELEQQLSTKITIAQAGD